MRTIAVLFVFLGSTYAAAQDPDPQPPKLVQYVVPPPSPVPIELATAAPPPVCAVKLQEMPIPRDVHFTMKKVKPPKIDEKIFAKPPATACP